MTPEERLERVTKWLRTAANNTWHAAKSAYDEEDYETGDMQTMRYVTLLQALVEVGEGERVCVRD